MKERIHPDKQKIKHIFAYRMDRLFRSTIDCLATVEELDEFGVGIHFCESGGQPLDLSSAVGRMLITILAAFGEMERNLISERTRMALQHLKDTGKRFTYDKYGWDVDEDNNLIENEKEQYWIEYIKVRYHEDDISISQIARELMMEWDPENAAHSGFDSALGLKKMIPKGVRPKLILTDPPYNLGFDYGDVNDSLEIEDYHKMLLNVFDSALQQPMKMLICLS